MNGTLLATIITGAVTVIVVFVSRYLETRAKIDHENRQRRIEVYDGMMSHFAEIFRLGKQGKSPQPQYMHKFYFDFSHKLIAWGSGDVIRDYNRLRETIQSETAIIEKRFLGDYGQLLMSVRRDVGHKDNLSKEDLLGTFITGSLLLPHGS